MPLGNVFSISYRSEMACGGVIVVSYTLLSPHASPHALSTFFSTISTSEGCVRPQEPLRGHSGHILGVLPLLQQACEAEDKVPGVPMAFQHVADSKVQALEGQASCKAMNSMSMQSLLVNQVQ